MVGDNGLLASLKLRVHAPLRSRLGYGLQRIRQAQAVSDRLHGELSGERVVRTSFRQYLDDWFGGKKAETAASTMTFYRRSLTEFLQFLGKRSDDPMTEVTKQDVVAFRNSLITQVSAKTANHDLKALKMLFKSARRDGVVTEDPTEFVETARRERRPKIKRPFTLPELRSVLDLASDEWRSMIIFRLYSGQRPGVNAVEGCIFACGKCIPDVLCLSV